jgi:hypothetical protein
MSSPITDLSPDTKLFQFAKLIKLKNEILSNYRNVELKHNQQKAHEEYFKVEDELKKFLKDKSIAKIIGVVEIPSKIMKLQPSRVLVENETFMAIYEYLEPYTNELKMIAVTYEEDDEEEYNEEKDNEEEDKKEDK